MPLGLLSAWRIWPPCMSLRDNTKGRFLLLRGLAPSVPIYRVVEVLINPSNLSSTSVLSSFRIELAPFGSNWLCVRAATPSKHKTYNLGIQFDSHRPLHKP